MTLLLFLIAGMTFGVSVCPSAVSADGACAGAGASAAVSVGADSTVSVTLFSIGWENTTLKKQFNQAFKKLSESTKCFVKREVIKKMPDGERKLVEWMRNVASEDVETQKMVNALAIKVNIAQADFEPICMSLYSVKPKPEAIDTLAVVIHYRAFIQSLCGLAAKSLEPLLKMLGASDDPRENMIFVTPSELLMGGTPEFEMSAQKSFEKIFEHLTPIMTRIVTCRAATKKTAGEKLEVILGHYQHQCILSQVLKQFKASRDFYVEELVREKAEEDRKGRLRAALESMRREAAEEAEAERLAALADRA